MTIIEIHPRDHHILKVVAKDGRLGLFDVSPYLGYEAFVDLNKAHEFTQCSNGGYFVEWDCGADLSADTIEAQWKILKLEAHSNS